MTPADDRMDQLKLELQEAGRDYIAEVHRLESFAERLVNLESRIYVASVQNGRPERAAHVRELAAEVLYGHLAVLRPAIRFTSQSATERAEEQLLGTSRQ